MSTISKSPVANSDNVKFLSSFPRSITSYSQIIHKKVDNYLCMESGLIFNATGARGEEDHFYSDMYDLHSESAHSEFKYMNQNSYKGIYDHIADFILSNKGYHSNGKMLDIGCGKGLLLSKLHRRSEFSKWDQYAVEPSKNAIPYFKEIMPHLNVFNGNFEDSTFRNQQDYFDLITANGVLEHVPNPLIFLELIHNCIKADGFLFIGVPNFCNNPIDLYTYDHLSKFTPFSIENIFHKAGFEIVNSDVTSDKVPMWFLLKKAIKKEFKVNERDINEQLKVHKVSYDYISNTFNSYQRCIGDGKSRIAIYGTGAIGILAIEENILPSDKVVCFLDDNFSLWDTVKVAKFIHSPEKMKTDFFDAIAISSNPCYHQRILEKIRSSNFPEKNIYY